MWDLLQTAVTTNNYRQDTARRQPARSEPAQGLYAPIQSCLRVALNRPVQRSEPRLTGSQAPPYEFHK